MLRRSEISVRYIMNRMRFIFLQREEKISVRKTLGGMVGELTAGSSDMEGLKEFKLILGGREG